jgi:hypothetical protein
LQKTFDPPGKLPKKFLISAHCQSEMTSERPDECELGARGMPTCGQRGLPFHRGVSQAARKGINHGSNAQTSPLSSGKFGPTFKKIGGRYRRGRLHCIRRRSTSHQATPARVARFRKAGFSSTIQTRLALESRQPLRMPGKPLRQHLDRYLPPQFVVGSAVHQLPTIPRKIALKRPGTPVRTACVGKRKRKLRNDPTSRIETPLGDATNRAARGRKRSAAGSPRSVKHAIGSH